MKLWTLPAATTKSDWVQLFEIIDEESGTPISLVGMTVNMAVRDPDFLNVLLTGSTSDGHVTLVDSNMKFQIRFAATEMANLCPKYYDVGAVVSDGTNTAQLFSGYLPVLSGIIP